MFVEVVKVSQGNVISDCGHKQKSYFAVLMIGKLVYYCSLVRKGSSEGGGGGGERERAGAADFNY